MYLQIDGRSIKAEQKTVATLSSYAPTTWTLYKHVLFNYHCKKLHFDDQ